MRKFASDKFEAQRERIIADGMENAKQDDIALKIDTAFFMIEKTNPILKGALLDNTKEPFRIFKMAM